MMKALWSKVHALELLEAGRNHGLLGVNIGRMRLPSGKRLHNYGKIHQFLMGKSTISTGPFSIAMLIYQRVVLETWNLVETHWNTLQFTMQEAHEQELWLADDFKEFLVGFVLWSLRLTMIQIDLIVSNVLYCAMHFR